jgi:hypothetical protein
MTAQESLYLTQLYQSNIRTDFVIYFNGCEYNVHSIILAMKCAYFEHIFFFECKEERDGKLYLDMENITQDDFQQFLKHIYGSPPILDCYQAMIILADYFQCDEVARYCQEFPLYQLPPTVKNTEHFIQRIIPCLKLASNVNSIEDQQLMATSLWFTTNIDVIIDMDVQVLRTIPLDWLRFVFGHFCFHAFESELILLDKAAQLYHKMGPTEELFSVLFEGINFQRIPLDGRFSPKYNFLYHSDNATVLEKIFSPHASFMTYAEMRRSTSFNLTKSWTVSSSTSGFCRSNICIDVQGQLQLLHIHDSHYNLWFSVYHNFSFKPYKLSGYLVCLDYSIHNGHLQNTSWQKFSETYTDYIRFQVKFKSGYRHIFIVILEKYVQKSALV